MVQRLCHAALPVALLKFMPISSRISNDADSAVAFRVNSNAEHENCFLPDVGVFRVEPSQILNQRAGNWEPRRANGGAIAVGKREGVVKAVGGGAPGRDGVAEECRDEPQIVAACDAIALSQRR